MEMIRMVFFLYAIIGLGLVVAAGGLFLILGLLSRSQPITEADITYVRMGTDHTRVDAQMTRHSA